eukprot:TRINITY_DN5101_c0_g2_i4.p1 TRINITY_DN5101_c0_g2~~TRINITY_DN5101_c0_g2_i4.p1  ORF type:complete len:272 (-),score=24.05 TRINITY_DN5101_c0_g2_i4:233-1048(-)
MVELPCFLKLGEQSVYLKVMWKYAAILVILASTLFLDFFNGVYSFTELIFKDIFKVLILSLIHAAFVYLIYFSAEKTLVIHTLLLSSMATTFITSWKILRRIPFSHLEYIGIAINVLGVYFCCYGTSAVDSTSLPTIESASLLGNLYAICASALLAVYLTHTEELVSEDYPLNFYLAVNACYVLVISYFVAVFAEDRVELLSVDPVKGFLSFTTSLYVAFIYLIETTSYMELLDLEYVDFYCPCVRPKQKDTYPTCLLACALTLCLCCRRS